MKQSFLFFVLSLLLGAGLFAQMPAGATNELRDYKMSAARAAFFKDSMDRVQRIQIIQMDQHIDSLLNTTKKTHVEATSAPTGSEYTECAPKPWFQIPNRPTWRALGGFQLGYSYPIGYHASIGVGARCQITPHLSFSTLLKGNQITANDSMGSWLRRTKTAASVRGAIEYTGLFPDEPAKYCWQVSGYFEKYFFPGTINWQHSNTLKHSLRLPDQRLGIQGRILMDAFTIGAFAEFFPRIETTRDGQRLKYGGGLFVGFGL